MKHIPFKNTCRAGFTLAESIIAIGILVVLITGFLAVFGPAAKSINDTLSAAEASRLQDTLTSELTTLRGRRENMDYDSDGFQKAFDWVVASQQPGRAVLVYNYRASPSVTRSDGTLEPYVGTSGIAGQDYILQPMARRSGDDELLKDLASVEGRLFMVKLVPMRKVADSWEPVGDVRQSSADSARILAPYDEKQTDFSSDPETYPEAILVLEASFYPLPTNSIAYVQKLDPASLSVPAFSRNVVVSR